MLIGIHAFDAQPSAIVATEMRRDSDRLLDEDNFAFIVDTLNDSRNGYMFVTTPLGAKLEQQISEEGEGNTRAGLINANVNRNWDGYWAPIPKAYTLTRVSLGWSLKGLDGLSHGLDLKLKPYVVGGVRDSNLTAAAHTISSLHDVGLDVKYGIAGTMNLDATLNTDFAQVEVDEQQVNLTRFSLFFFSRKIGLSDTGQPIPIIGGGRLTGKSGRHNIALLDIQTDSAFSRPGDNFLVGRYSTDVLKRSRIGAIFVNKETMGGDAHYNRTMGADANLVVGRNLQIASFVAKTATPGLDGKDLAFFGRIAYRDPAWNVWLNYLDVQDNFNAEVGFVQRRGIKTTKAYFSPTPRPGRDGIRMLEPMFVLTYITDQQNRMVARTQHFMNGFYMDDGSFINVIYQRNATRCRRARPCGA